MANTICLEWQDADVVWSSTQLTWDDFCLVLSSSGLAQDELDALDKEKKQRLIKLIMRLDGVKIYDEFKKPSEAVLTVKNVELLVEDVKATIRGFKHETE
tara:strand:+ start:118 stop:417 length:300 start_codon:yes stop_codon:yes gene_type:complete